MCSSDLPCKINIIPFNEHPGSSYERPADSTIEAFHTELNRLGVHVLLRRSMGRDIFAACGQLNSTHKENSATMDISNSKLAGMPKAKRELLAQHKAEFEARNAVHAAMSFENEDEAQ